MFVKFIEIVKGFFSWFLGSMGTLKCLFAWGMVAICIIAFIYFLTKMKFKQALASFVMLGLSTFIYDFVGCNDCGNKLFLSVHFGAACPVETQNVGQQSENQESQEESKPDVCRDSEPAGCGK